MKKKLLFIMPSLAAGGGEKSLINLLSQIDADQFDVDLYLFHQHGLFMDYVPAYTKVLAEQETYKRFVQPLLQSVAALLLKGKLRLVLHRIMFAFYVNYYKNQTSIAEQKSWKHMAAAIEPLEKKYDAAIGFLEKSSTYFCVDKVKADVKIGWVHIDYDKQGMDPRFDARYFSRLDHIVTVSEECEEILKKRFPESAGKMSTIYNIISPAVIRRMAAQHRTDIYDRSGDEIILLSIGRLHPQKGFDYAIGACAKLIERGFNIRWHIIGEGDERQQLTERIKKHKLEERFFLEGLKANPYPYIKQCDVYVQPSRYEGKSIAVDEAKILQKPIVLADFSTAKDQIRNGINGVIVPLSADGVADGIMRMIQDTELRKRAVRQLSLESLGTESEIMKLYKLAEG